MLITFIVTVAILAVFYLLINIYRKKSVKPDYEFFTEAPRFYRIFAHTGFCICFFVLALEIIICFFPNNSIALWVVYGIVMFFAILALVILFDLYLTYEAIDGDKLYIRRFFKIEQYNVNDIKRIDDIRQSMIGFYGEGGKRLFIADSMTPGIQKLVRLIGERKSDEAKEEYQKAAAESEAVLTEIGREYRASYKEHDKKFLICFAVAGIAILLAITLLMLLIEAGTVTIVMLDVLAVFALALNFFVLRSNMKKELGKDDLTLGKRHKYENKRVKGASKSLFTAICICCVLFMLVGAVLFSPLAGVLEEGPNYDEFTKVTGKIEYGGERGVRSSYIAIGFYDIPTEYRLYSMYLDEFDYSFFDEVEKGDTVTILVGNGEDSKFSNSNFGKDRWNSFYYLATDDKEYFSRENYDRAREHNDKVGIRIVGMGAATIIASAIVLIIASVVCKKRAKKEDIVIYKY